MAAGGTCRCRADRRRRFEQSCRERQHCVEAVVVGAGEVAAEGVFAVEGVVVGGAGIAAADGVVGLGGIVVGAGEAAAEGLL